MWTLFYGVRRDLGCKRVDFETREAAHAFRKELRRTEGPQLAVCMLFSPASL